MRLITYDQLKPEKGIPYTREWIAKLVKAGKFPMPVPLSKKRKAWVDEEIDQHIGVKEHPTAPGAFDATPARGAAGRTLGYRRCPCDPPRYRSGPSPPGLSP